MLKYKGTGNVWFFFPPSLWPIVFVHSGQFRVLYCVGFGFVPYIALFDLVV